MRNLLLASMFLFGTAAIADTTVCGTIGIRDCGTAPCYLAYTLQAQDGSTVTVDPVSDQAAQVLSQIGGSQTMNVCVTGTVDFRGHLEATAVQ